MLSLPLASPIASSPELGPELAIVLQCARTQLGTARQAKLAKLWASGIDVDQLLSLARAHGLAPLLYWHLKALPAETVPASVLAQLREEFLQNSLHAFSLSTELSKVLDYLATNGVPALPLKGVTLAASVYGDLTLRQPGDVDVLIHPQDAPAAIPLLEQFGYQADFADIADFEAQLSPTQQHTSLRVRTGLGFYKSDPSVQLDLHWRLFPSWFGTPLEFTELWQRRETVALRGVSVPSLSTEDLLVFLCLHGSKHRWKSLKWVCDVAELLRTVPDLDWDLVTRLSRRQRRMVLLGLALAHDLLDAPLPAHVAKQLAADQKMPALVQQAQAWIFQREQALDSYGVERIVSVLTNTRIGSGGATPHVADLYRDIIYSLHPQLGGWRVVYGWLAFIFVPTIFDVQWVSLPARLFPLYYPLRLIRFLRRAGAGVVRLMRRRFRTGLSMPSGQRI